jgi:hypothetical protein
MKMDDDSLLSQIDLLEKQAIGFFTSHVQEEQTKALDYYLGKPFGTEEEGRSAVVSTDVWDVVEGLTPLILKPFVQSDEVVTFRAFGPEDEEAAQQESEYVNWVATQQNDSFTEMVSWVKSGLLQKNGVVKYWWDTSTRSSVERYFGLSEDQMAMLAQEPNVEIIEHTASTDQMGVPAHDVTLRTSEEIGVAKYCVIPSEEFLIHRDASTPNPKTASFVQHRQMVSIGKLRSMGYDVDDDISDDGTYDPRTMGQALSRDQNGEYLGHDEGADKSAREVLFRETYLLVDTDGDGIPELRKVCAVGKKILANEETEEIPFSAWTPYQMLHRFHGRCPADETLEIQLVKSTLWRQNMDNIYTINNNRVYVNDSVNTDDLIDNQIAGVVRIKGMGNVTQSVMPAPITPIGAVIQPMIEYLDAAKENRTGFSRYNQGSADLGNQKTLGEIQIVSEQSGQRVELMARQFANGLADLMRGLHGLIRRHSSKTETARLRNGKWVEVDPRGWKKRYDMTISVGLGTADQRTKMQGAQLLLQTQLQLAPAGVVQPENFVEAATKLAEAVGFKNAEKFFGMPQQAEGLPPQVQQVLQQAQQEMQQLQQQVQELSSGIAAKQIDAQSKVQIEQLRQQDADAERQFKAQLAMMQSEQAKAIEGIKDDQKRDAEELKAWLALTLQNMQAESAKTMAALTADVEDDLAEEDDPANMSDEEIMSRLK